MRNKVTIGIYKITHAPTGRCYIGQSIVVESRLNGHVRDLIKGKHKSPFLQRVWDRHSQEEFTFELIEVCLTEELSEREQFWMDNTDSVFNVSRCTTAFWRGMKHTQEFRDKMKGNKRSVGVHRSEETRQKMRLANLGKVISQETRDKISRATKGRKKSPETIERMKLASKGRRLSEETKAKIGAASKGRIPNEEARRKMSLARKGKKISEEARANMRVAQQASWARRKEAKRENI